MKDSVGNDMVATIAIGRNYGGKNIPLSPYRWRNFKLKTKNLISQHAQVVGFSNGRGVGSDSTRAGKPEDSFLVVAINPKKVKKFRADFQKLLKMYNQSSAACAIDRKHKLVFS